jgi:hypothetical protein
MQLVNCSYNNMLLAARNPDALRFNTMVEELSFRVQKVAPTADLAYSGDVDASRVLRSGLNIAYHIVALSSSSMVVDMCSITLR